MTCGSFEHYAIERREGNPMKLLFLFALLLLCMSCTTPKQASDAIPDTQVVAPASSFQPGSATVESDETVLNSTEKYVVGNTTDVIPGKESTILVRGTGKSLQERYGWIGSVVQFLPPPFNGIGDSVWKTIASVFGTTGTIGLLFGKGRANLTAMIRAAKAQQAGVALQAAGAFALPMIVHSPDLTHQIIAAKAAATPTPAAS